MSRGATFSPPVTMSTIDISCEHGTRLQTACPTIALQQCQCKQGTMTTQMSSTPLVVNGLSKSYASTQVLHSLHLEVTHGAIHGLVGLNGSGKTTTLECILGLNQITQGQISVLGYQPHQLYQA